MRIGEIIKQYRDEHQLTMREFASLSGISPSYVNKLEKDYQNKTSLTLGKISQISKTLGMSADDLLAIMDNTRLDLEDIDLDKTNAPATLPVPDLSGLKQIPVLGPTACGEPMMAQRSYDYAMVDTALRADFALEAVGNSMTGCGIISGSLVLFKDAEAVDNGTIAAVSVGDSTTIKKFYQYGDTVILRPCNPEFEDLEYSGEELEEIHVFGRAIACLTEF